MNLAILILIYSIFVLFFFYDVIILSNTFASGDSFNPYAIHHILDKLRLISSEWPQWQPWIFSGMPTLEAFTYVNVWKDMGHGFSWACWDFVALLLACSVWPSRFDLFLFDVAAELAKTVGERDFLQNELTQTQEVLAQTEAELASTQATLAQTQATLQETEAELLGVRTGVSSFCIERGTFSYLPAHLRI